MLEILTRRAAGDAPFQAELARHFAAKGNRSLADVWRNKARSSFDQRLAKEPENGALAAGLAQLLWDQHEIENPIRWTVLTPTKMESEGGATLTGLDDLSILAGGANPPSEQYTIAFLVQERIDIQSIRLEALTHASLPGHGPGRSLTGRMGTFSMIRWDLTAKAPDGADSPRSLHFRDASADHFYPAHPLELRGHWNIEFGQGKDHTSVWNLTEPVTLEAGTELLSQMRFPNGSHPFGSSLGRFRLSVSGDPDVFRRERQTPCGNEAHRSLGETGRRLSRDRRPAGARQAAQASPGSGCRHRRSVRGRCRIGSGRSPNIASCSPTSRPTSPC